MTISGGDDGADLRIVRIVGKSVQRGFHQLPFLNPCYIGFVHVHFDLVGFHVHDGGDARARESAAGRVGRDHFADLSVFGHHDARKGCANGAIIHRLLGHRDTRFGGSHLLLGKRDFCAQAVSRGEGVIESLLRLDARLPQLLGALQLDFGVAKLDFEIRDSSLRGVAVRFRGIQGAFVVGIIERSKELALFDARAFVKENAGDAPGDFGGDGGAAARRDIPAGIQRSQGTSGFRLGSRGDLHDGLLIPQSEGGGHNSAKNNHGDGGIKYSLPHSGLAALAIMDAQGAKVRF